MPPEDSIAPDLAEKGRELVAKAKAWIEEHPGGFTEMLQTAYEVTAAGRDVSRATVYTWMQDLGRSRVSEVPTWSRNNNLWSPLARYMMLVDPSLRIPTKSGCSVDAAYPDIKELPMPVLREEGEYPWLQLMRNSQRR